MKLKTAFMIPLLTLVLFSCKKEEEFIRNADLMVVNAGVDLGAVKVNMQNTPITYATTPQIAYGAGSFYYNRWGSTSTRIVASNDTTGSLYNGNLELITPVSTIYVVGQAPNIETIFTNETNLPFVRTDVLTPDSVINIRFANLSPNSQSVNIKIQNSATGEVVNFTYKSITAFKAYTAKSTNTSYIFEVRDSQTNALLLTYTFAVTATNRFKNVMLILKGLRGTTSGTNAFSFSPVNYF